MTIWRYRERKLSHQLIIIDFVTRVLIINETPNSVAWETKNNPASWWGLVRGGNIGRSRLWEQVYPR